MLNSVACFLGELRTSERSDGSDVRKSVDNGRGGVHNGLQAFGVGPNKKKLERAARMIADTFIECSPEVAP